MNSRTVKAILGHAIGFCFCLFTIAQVALPLRSLALGRSPHYARSVCVRYPFEEVPSSTADVSAVSVLQFARVNLPSESKLPKRGPVPQINLPALPRVTALFHRRITSFPAADEYH